MPRLSLSALRAATIPASIRALALVAVTAAATSAVLLPAATAETPAPQAPAPQLVPGLPDFTQLVQQVGPGVVSVEAEVGGGREAVARNGQPLPDEEQIPEFFRRFFGPDLPIPGMPGPGPGPDAGPQGVSLGSGFIISPDGYVLTNHHVVDGADSVTVKLSDRREFPARVIGSDQQSDVALLKIDAKGLPALRIGQSNALRPGQWVVAIGSPFGFDHSVTAGIVSAVGRANPYADQRYVPFIQTDVAINRGNSGGPLLDTRGQVVGINSQIFSNSGGYMGVSFAIPIDIAMNAVKQLKATGKVQRGQIGVRVQQIDAERARGLKLPDTRGALVADVEPGSPAEKAGLEPMDVIRSFNGITINDSSDLPPLVGAQAPGSRAMLGVFRNGQTREFTVTLGALQEASANAPAPPRAGEGASAGDNPLGLVTQPLDAAGRKRLGLGPDEGVAVVRINGLAARAAGLQPGDVILQVGRTKVGNPAELDRLLAGVKPGQTVMLLVRNAGGRGFIAVTPREAGK